MSEVAIRAGWFRRSEAAIDPKIWCRRRSHTVGNCARKADKVREYQTPTEILQSAQLKERRHASSMKMSIGSYAWHSAGRRPHASRVMSCSHTDWSHVSKSDTYVIRNECARKSDRAVPGKQLR